jgi:hypothetical protein
MAEEDDDAPKVPPALAAAAIAKEMAGKSVEERYFETVARPLRVCARYRPMFGQGRKGGLSLTQFQALYRADPFYAWVGLDAPLMYAAHKAAGGMTSIYRQLGIGCQWLFNLILQDSLGISAEDASWTYQVPGPSGKPRTLSLDGRIPTSEIRDKKKRGLVEAWLVRTMDRVMLEKKVRQSIRGVVFEVRQGYKSKDSKRQNADISNASNAYAHQYVPIVLLLSTQIDGDIALRYAQARWLLLKGTTEGTDTDSTYVFCRDILGYDMGAFFARNSTKLKAELEHVLHTLLEPEK